MLEATCCALKSASASMLNSAIRCALRSLSKATKDESLLRKLRNGRSYGVKHGALGHFWTPSGSTQSKPPLARSTESHRFRCLESGSPQHTDRQIISVSLDQPKCTHTCGARVKGESLPSMGPVSSSWMTYEWLCVSTIHHAIVAQGYQPPQ